MISQDARPRCRVDWQSCPLLLAQAQELALCLRSGLPCCVPWALNALALATFQARPELLLPGLPGLLPALLQVGRGVPCLTARQLSP